MYDQIFNVLHGSFFGVSGFKNSKATRENKKKALFSGGRPEALQYAYSWQVRENSSLNKAVGGLLITRLK